MNEIKIRVWDKEKKQMIYLERFNYPYMIGFSDETKKIYPYQFDELMQYIGLKDKNKKDIYDKDIVKFGRFVGNPTTGTYWVEDIGVVKWINSRSSFRLCYNGQEQKIRDCYYYEVIGNIYENKDLII